MLAFDIELYPIWLFLTAKFCLFWENAFFFSSLLKNFILELFYLFITISVNGILKKNLIAIFKKCLL